MTTRIYFSILTAIGITVAVFSCSKKEKTDHETMSADSTAPPAVEGISSSAAMVDKDSSRKFIRTAELKFRVKNVIKTTYQIEDIANRLGGFVSYTNLSSNKDYQKTTRISSDSSLESTHFTVLNTMTLRVPNTRLDSTLKAIAPLVEYMDYRIIKADDVGLQMLANKLAEERISKHERRMNKAIDDRGKKLRETTDAEENLYYKKETADNATISNLSLADQVTYSTVNLSIYQREEVKNEVIANDKSVESYEPNFGLKLLESLKDGWRIIESITLFVLRLWGLILFGILIFYLFKKFGNRPKK